MPHFVLDARTATPHFPGIGRYVGNLARAMAPLLESDERLTVLYDPAHQPPLTPSPAMRMLPATASPFSAAQQIVLPRLLNRLGADLYHSAYILMPYAPGVPTLLTVYDLIPLLFPQQSTARARLLIRGASRLALRAAKQVIAISDTTRRDYLIHLGVPPDGIRTIPLAADPVFRPQTAEAIAGARARYGLPDQYLLYLGSNKPHKNIERLVEAWALLQPQSSTLAVAGAWDPRYPASRQRAEALGLDSSMRWLGPVAESDLPALYSGAALFVFPSLYEGFGLPVLEAMACGVAVVCSNSSSLPEVAGDAAMLADPTDTEALSSAMRRALEDASLRQQMREKGLEQSQRFSWPKTARLSLQVYRKTYAHPTHL